MPDTPSRDDLAADYLDQLPFDPYPVQEEALLAWFDCEQGVLVCAPTGMGKTLIAEAAIFEALHLGHTVYYTTPLIALTEQKFREIQQAAERWGFSADDVGLVTGNRRVNPEARVLVVVAEILLNRLLDADTYGFDDVHAVVMDEFHSFSDPERGIVWELSLGMLPKHVRLLLLSATVGNAADFVVWLNRSHGRKVQLIQSDERRVPLHFEWVGDQLLHEQLESMAQGDEDQRRTPALIFCFNRSECWSVAEQLKGRNLLDKAAQQQLTKELERFDLSRGAGPRLKQILTRGVGIHHAGILPRYRRIIEDLFQRKLLSVCVCTETLAAGVNLPARSVLLITLLKGPPDRKKLIDSSSAHQIFGRAGRPQFDSRGFVYAMAHDDDVKMLRWREKYDAIPDDSPDPNLRRAKKQMKKKMPKRRTNQQYWTEKQFLQLQEAKPGRLASRGRFPWRLLAWLLMKSPDVDRLREVLQKRLLEQRQMVGAERELTRMLVTLHAGGFVQLDPEPPDPTQDTPPEQPSSDTPVNPPEEPAGLFGQVLQSALSQPAAPTRDKAGRKPDAGDTPPRPPYEPRLATPTERLAGLLAFRSVHPVYGAFLIEQLGPADDTERIQALESILEMPGSMLFQVRVPPIEQLPPGWLAANGLDETLLSRGLVTADQLQPSKDEDRPFGERPPRILTFAEKLRLLFQTEYPEVHDLRVSPVWCVGDLMQFNGDFDKYVKGRDLAKQEGVVFRHCLRMILLCGEFSRLAPPDADAEEWRNGLTQLSRQLQASCRAVDPDSTDKTIEMLESESQAAEDEQTRLTV